MKVQGFDTDDDSLKSGNNDSTIRVMGSNLWLLCLFFERILWMGSFLFADFHASATYMPIKMEE